NFVVLTAALSVYNSGVYCNSRMLFGLAEQGDAPRWLARTDRRGVPVTGILVSALITLLCVLVNYLAPKEALTLLMSLVVAALVINWAMISMIHLRFRAALRRAGRQPLFAALWHPWGNLLCLGFLAFILVVMWLVEGTRLSVYAIPVWLLFLLVCHLVRNAVTGGRQA